MFPRRVHGLESSIVFCKCNGIVMISNRFIECSQVQSNALPNFLVPSPFLAVAILDLKFAYQILHWVVDEFYCRTYKYVLVIRST